MLPPTYCTCLEMYDFAQPADVLAAAEDRDLTSVEPQAVVDDDGAYLSIPDRLVALGEDVAARMRAMTGLGRRDVRRAGALRARAEPRHMTLDGTNTWVLREPGAAPVRGGRPGPGDRRAPRRRRGARR